ncbi:MAG: TolC family protein [Thermodesulfobacteriota bacterium]
MMFRVFLWTGLIFISWINLSAAEEPKSLGLQESIEIALKNNLGLLSAKEEIRSAELKKKAAFSDFFPKLNVQYGYTKLNEAPAVFVPKIGYIPLGWEETYQLSIGFEQPIFTGFSLKLLYELTDLGLNMAKVRYELFTQEIIYRVKEGYFQILKAKKLREVAAQALKQIEAHWQVAKQFYAAGMIPKNDLLQTEVQLAQYRQNLIKAENAVDLAEANFYTILRLPAAEKIQWLEVLRYTPFPYGLLESQNIALANRPEIKELATLGQQARKNVDLARSAYYPKIVLSGNYLKAEDKPFPNAESWQVMALAKWTFWEWGKTNWQVDEAKVRVKQAENTLEDLKDKIKLEVKQAYLNMQEAEKNIPVAQKAIEQAEENLRINQARYQEQVATSTEVLDAQTLLVQALTNYTNALADYNMAQAKLVRAMGINK